MGVLGVDTKDLVLAFVMGRVMKKRQAKLSWWIVGTNLGLGVAALYLLSKRGETPHVSLQKREPGKARLSATFLPVEERTPR